MKFFYDSELWNLSCEEARKQFNEYIEHYIIAEKIAGLNIKKIPQEFNGEEYFEYYLLIPNSVQQQACFYMWPSGTNEATIELYEGAFNIQIETCEELKKLGFQIFNFSSIHSEPGDRYLFTSIKMNEFKKLMIMLSDWWKY